MDVWRLHCPSGIHVRPIQVHPGDGCTRHSRWTWPEMSSIGTVVEHLLPIV